MKEIKHYYQEASFSCGPASLLIAYRSLGLDHNEVAICAECGTTKEDGTDWGQMFYHTVLMGFPAELKSNATYKDIKKDFKRGRIIVAWCTDDEPASHYAVVSGVLDDLIELTDPGQRSEKWPSVMTKEEFMNKWFTETAVRTYLLIKPKA